jgi:serine protease AprX
MTATLLSLLLCLAGLAGSDSSVIRAIDQAIALKNKFNFRVINLSLGRPVFESYRLDPLCQAVERAWAAGIVVVAAAGNEGRNQSQGTNGYATIISPANDPLVITVGAMKTMSTITRADDLVASYSSKGPTLLDHVVKPDLVAPGKQMVSLLASKSLIASNASANRILYSGGFSAASGFAGLATTRSRARAARFFTAMIPAPPRWSRPAGCRRRLP